MRIPVRAYWMAGYVVLIGSVFVMLLVARPIDDARAALLLSFSWLLIGVVAIACSLGDVKGEVWGKAPRAFAYIPIAAVAAFVLVVNLDVVAADIYYKRGSNADGARQWVASVANYQKALAVAPAQDWYYIFLGRAFLALAEGKPQPKDAAAVNAPPFTVEEIRSIPASQVSGMGRAQLLEASRAAFEEALRLNPLNPDHYANLGRLYRYWGESVDRAKLDLSVKYLEDAIVVTPNTAHVYADLARTFISKEEYQRAVDTLNRTLKLDPEYAVTRSLTADAYQGLEQWDLAMAEYVKAIELDPSYLSADTRAEQKVQKFVAAGKGEELAEAVHRLAKQYPTSIAVRNLNGYILTRLSRYEEAVVEYQAMLAVDASDWIAHRNLALTYQKLGLNDKAVASAQAAVAGAPQGEKKSLEALINTLQGRQP